LPVSLLLLDLQQDAECFVLLKLFGFQSRGLSLPAALLTAAVESGQQIRQSHVNFRTTQGLGSRVKLNEQGFNL
jgi:hypothetical protein